MYRLSKAILAVVLLPMVNLPATADDDAVPELLRDSFAPPDEFEGDFGDYQSPLTFNDGTRVVSAGDWRRRREEILDYWHNQMGAWPPLVEAPRVEYLEETRRDGMSQHRVRAEVAPGLMLDGFLLIPDGEGPFPGVVVPYYDAETGAGLKGELRDFGFQLTRRGFVSLSIGGVNPRRGDDVTPEEREIQPLSFLGYVAANCHTALAQLASVDPERIGVVGHSFGGKWALFASCLYEKFACAAWSDPGIVFDEARANVNYWEPWYLGYDSNVRREPGIPNADNPRTGAYRRLVADGRDLHELHALMAPRPFLVSGGSEDHPERWQPLNHSIAVNRLLGHENRVAMTNRAGHSPTEESNEQVYRFFAHFLADGSN